MNEMVKCPHCGDARIVGIEYPSVYDGVLLWRCGQCGHAWARFTDGGRLGVASESLATLLNIERMVSAVPAPCDMYPDDDADGSIGCGWKRTVQGVRRALRPDDRARWQQDPGYFELSDDDET